MVKYFIRYGILFVVLILAQVFVFNNIQISGYINPYIYVLLILLLPYEIPGWALLLMGLLVGVSVDTFMNTYGIHSSATLFLAFLRPYVLQVLADRDDIDRKGSPSITSSGLVWFLKYVTILVFAHHLMLFFIESFSVLDFFTTLWRSVLSTLTTTAFIVIIMLLFNRN